MGRPATLKVDIVGDSRKLGGAVDDADSRLSRLGGRAKLAGVAIGAGLAGAAVAAGKFAVSAISAASDAQQAFGAVDSIFGKYAANVKSNAQGAADAVGLSSTAYANMAAILGSQLTNMGRSQAEAAKQTDNLIHLGSDLAATYGGSVSDAVEAVSSLMKGETDPIERYGVSIKQSDINARLAADGLTGLSGAAAKQAQATTVLKLLTEQTSAAHGQFAKQTDTLAEKQQILGAKFDNIKTKIGSALLPAVSQLFTWFDDKIAPATTRLASAFADKAAPAIHAVARFVSDNLIPAARSIVTWFGDHIVPLLSGVVSAALSGIRSLFDKVSSAIDSHREQLSQLGHALQTVAGFLVDVLGPALKLVVKVGFKVLGTEISIIIDAVSDLVSAFDWVIDRLKQIGGLVSGSIGKAAGILSKLNPFGGPPLAIGGPQLVGPVDLAPQVSRLITATAGDPLAGVNHIGTAGAGGAIVVDNRDQRTTIRVDGALDPVAVADQLSRILRDHQLRLGQLPAYGAA